jgi:hypothetical protein
MDSSGKRGLWFVVHTLSKSVLPCVNQADEARGAVNEAEEDVAAAEMHTRAGQVWHSFG